jgi:hypothetical protein
MNVLGSISLMSAPAESRTTGLTTNEGWATGRERRVLTSKRPLAPSDDHASHVGVGVEFFDGICHIGHHLVTVEIKAQ